MAETNLNILVLQGPNLNLLGQRETDIYGGRTLEQIHELLRAEAGHLAVQIDFFQSNGEGEIIDRIHQARTDGVDGIVINAAAYTHTSIGISDALAAVQIPYVEVHISNVHAREEFRHHSYISAGAAGLVVGFGEDGYRLGLAGLVGRLRAS